MPYARFVITYLNFAEDYGFVRQLSSPEGKVLDQQISFTVSRIAQAIYNADGSACGFRLPDAAIRAYVPQIGDELLGVIAADLSGGMAFDTNGNPFLRNCFYADEREFFKGVDFSIDESDDDAPDDGDVYTGSSEEDGYGHYEDPDEGQDEDEVSTSTVYSRALHHFGGNHELAREATELYAGDFV